MFGTLAYEIVDDRTAIARDGVTPVETTWIDTEGSRERENLDRSEPLGNSPTDAHQCVSFIFPR